MRCRSGGREAPQLSVRPAPLVLAFALLVVAVPAAPATGGALAFSDPVRVGPNIGEPGLRVTDEGIFVHYPGLLHRSTDGGASFQRLNPQGMTILGGDADMTVLKDGTLLYSDLAALVSISVGRSTTTDGSGLWVQNMVASNLVGVDRQWIETGTDPITGLEVVYLVYNQIGIGLNVMKSSTGGVLFEQVATVPGTKGYSCFRGNLAVSPADGALYLADCYAGGPRVWISLDGGLTWTWRQVDYHPYLNYSGFLFANVATDAAGNVYMAWAEHKAGKTEVYMAGSQDRGATWTPRVRMTSDTSAGVMPWLVGGSAGRVGVAWYSADRQGIAGSMPDATQWSVSYGVFTDFFGARAVTVAPVTSDVVQRGFICGSGTGCNGGRNLLDFFQVMADDEGRAHVVWADGCDACSSAATSRSARVTFAKQIDGPLLVG